MADDIDNLLAIAEIAGVFVGFAALVTVVARRGGESRDFDAFALALIVIFSVMVIAAALLPIVLQRYALSEAFIWRVSSGFFYLINLLAMVFLSRRTVGFSAAHSRARVLSLMVWSSSPFFHIPLLLCAFGVAQHMAPAFFLTAIVVVVFQVALIFANFVISLVAPESR